MESQNEKIEWISMAKGFGILGIIAVHTVQQFDIVFVSGIAYSGMFSVQLFFIISAYLTFKSLDKNVETWTRKSYFKYLAHKILRFVPVLYTACLWHLVMYCIQIGGIPDIYDSIWRKGFFAVTFLNGFSYHYINPWMNWYVGDIVIFIALAPLLKKLLNTPKKSILFFIISVFIGYASTLILEKCGFDTGWYFYLWLPRQLPVLTLGIIFYHLSKNPGFENNKDSLLTFSFVLVFGFLLTKSWKPILENHVQYGILLFAFSYILFNKFGKYFSWLKILGNNTYGIYLYHGCLLPSISSLIRKIGFNNSSCNFILCYFAVLFCSLLLSIVVNKIIEKPFFNFSKRLGI